MNEHIRRGLEAIQKGDHDTAATEFYEALNDPNKIVQRIAQNKLLDLFPENVYASTHSNLYHRLNCPAKNVTPSWHIVRFRDWKDAKEAGKVPCNMCKPISGKPR